MNDNLNSKDQMPSNIGGQPGFISRHEARMQRRAQLRSARGGFGWLGGAILIGVGLILMLQNLGYTLINLTNWWALFILLPAIGAFGAAWRSYQVDGRLSMGARSSLVGGLILVLIAAIFLFGLDWGLLGPVVIILAGAGLLLNTVLPG
jgi:hypothetical protein